MARFLVRSLAACSLILALTAGVSLGQELSRRPPRIEAGGPVDVDALTNQASVIVRGVITGSQTRWVGRVIYTDYNLSVHDTVKGSALSRITVSLPGGTMGSVELVVPGSPILTSGDEIVFFGQRFEDRDSYKPVGIFDGVIPVQQEAGVGATVAPRGPPENVDEFLNEVRGRDR